LMAARLAVSTRTGPRMTGAERRIPVNVATGTMINHCRTCTADVEQQPADGVGGVVHRPAQLEPDAAGGQLLDDVAGIGKRPCEAVELGDHEGVAGAAGREGLA